MFRIDWVEKYFSRVKPWHVIVIWVPFVLWQLWSAAWTPGTHAPGIAGFFLFGLFVWTLLEYFLHRVVFHFVPRADSELQRDIAWLIHGIHHDYPYDPDRLVMPPAFTALVAGLLWFPVKLVFGTWATSFFAGLVLGYVAYDLTHYWLHHAIPRSEAGRWLRKYHYVHHFSTPDQRYGITTPLWDLVFGTFPRDRWQGAVGELPPEPRPEPDDPLPAARRPTTGAPERDGANA